MNHIETMIMTGEPEYNGQFLGYRKGADGLPEIIPEEAEIVRRIYREFMQGQSSNAIAKELIVVRAKQR